MLPTKRASEWIPMHLHIERRQRSFENHSNIAAALRVLPPIVVITFACEQPLPLGTWETATSLAPSARSGPDDARSIPSPDPKETTIEAIRGEFKDYAAREAQARSFADWRQRFDSEVTSEHSLVLGEILQKVGDSPLTLEVRVEEHIAGPPTPAQFLLEQTSHQQASCYALRPVTGRRLFLVLEPHTAPNFDEAAPFQLHMNFDSLMIGWAVAQPDGTFAFRAGPIDTAIDELRALGRR